jgi:hypothetical protein
MQYTQLTKTYSSPRSSIVNFDTIDNGSSDQSDPLCSSCRNKSLKNQEITHTLMECLTERCQLLENEVIRLKDRDIKSRLQIKELESRITSLDDAMKKLVAPTQAHATPYSFGIGHKQRHLLKKTNSEDIPLQQPELNYNNILPSKPASKERVGLFGSLGAASQYWS